MTGIKSNILLIQNFHQTNFFLTLLFFVLIYIVITAFSLPGAVMMTLVGGWLFGLLQGTLIVSFASTIGATLAMLTVRYLVRESMEKKFKKIFTVVNSNLEKEGGLYLFTLRLIPAFPFFVINIVMGLTRFHWFKYFYISQIGMLPGTIVYVNAGLQLNTINRISDILSTNLILSFGLLACFPWLAKSAMNFIKNKNKYKHYHKPKKFDYNLAVIGAGSGGLVSSYIASSLKAKVCLIEKYKMGGDCLNTGCVPSKALISSAKIAYLNKNYAQYGMSNLKIEFDFKNIMQRLHNIIQKIEPHDSIERYSKLGVECITAEAKILSPYEIKLSDGQKITAQNIIIASGANPIEVDILGIENVKLYTSDTIWSITEQPKNLVVMGAGPIGAELAQSFSRLGSQVTLINKNKGILNKEEEQASKIVQQQFENEGIRILDETNINFIYSKNEKSYINITRIKTKEKLDIKCDVILMAIGRQANTQGIFSDNIKIELNPNGTVKINEYCQTNFPNIYAVGDVAGPYQFTHFSAHQAWYASVNALLGKFKKFKANYNLIPRVTFTDPQIASVGLTQQDAKSKQIEIEVNHFDMSELDRAITDSKTKGFIQIITPKNSDKILGCTIVSEQADNLLAEVVLAMKYKLGLKKILGTIHTYPTHSEAIKYVAGVWQKKYIPHKILNILQKLLTKNIKK